MSTQLDIAALRARLEKARQQSANPQISLHHATVDALLDAYDERDRLRNEVSLARDEAALAAICCYCYGDGVHLPHDPDNESIDDDPATLCPTAYSTPLADTGDYVSSCGCPKVPCEGCDKGRMIAAQIERDRLRADAEWLKAENERLATVERAALAVDRLYAGSYHGEALTMNIIDGVAIRTGERFDALRAALTPPSGGEAQLFRGFGWPPPEVSHDEDCG